jgi:nitronate monooxygenase
MVALTNFGELVKTALEEEVDLIFSGAGLPLDLPRFLRGHDRTKLVPIVSSGRAAKIIATRWMERYDHPPDAVVVEGPRAGGSTPARICTSSCASGPPGSRWPPVS